MKRAPLLLALLISLLLHLAMLGSGKLPAFSMQQDEQLQPITMRLATLDLTARPAPAPPPGAAIAEAGALRVASLPPPGRIRHIDASATSRRQPASAPVPQAAASQPPLASAPEASAALQVSPAPQASPPIASVPLATMPPQDDASAPEDQHYLSASHRYRHFPARAQLTYQVYYGVLMAGTATINWEQDGDRYRLESRIKPIIGPLLRYRSEGSISREGLKPDNYAAWRNDDAREHARFDWNNGLLEYGDDGKQQVPLQSGAQDIFSLIYQLALKGAAHPPVQITTGKKVYQYPLAPVGQADFDTGSGIIRALVFRAQGDGDQTEFWLAPEFANQPIRIIRSDSRMKLDMRAIDVVIDDHSEWQQSQTINRKTK